MFYRFIRALFYLPIKIFYPTKIIGKQNLPTKKCILYCNHQSNLDSILIGVNLKQQISFLGKSELFKSKISSAFFRAMKVIKVDRGKADIGAIKQVLTLLKNNGILGVFPAGTRTKIEGQVEEYKNGIALFAIKANAPVVPMIFLKKPKIFRRNKLIIGQPFYLENINGKISKEHLEQCVELIKLKQQELFNTYNE